MTTKEALLQKLLDSPRGIVSVVYSNSSSRRSNNSFGLREKKAALSLERQGLIERYQDGQPTGRGVMTFKITAKGISEASQSTY